MPTRFLRQYEVTEIPYFMHPTNDAKSGYDSFPILTEANVLSITEDDIQEAYDACVTRFYDTITSDALNAAQFIAERKETIALIATSAKRIANWYRTMKKGFNPFKRNQRINSKDASSYWLEYTYGWTPTLMDVHAAMELQKLEPPAFAFKTWSRFKSEYVDNTSFTAFKGTKQNFVGIKKGGVTLKVKILVSDPAVAFANQMGLLNPAALAWELLPYSFVVDWFIPIGDWLKSQSALMGFSLQDRSLTKFRIVIAQNTLKGGYAIFSARPACGYANVPLVNGSARVKLIHGTRTTNFTWPQPIPPTLKNPLSTSHAISALALLRQRFK